MDSKFLNKVKIYGSVGILQLGFAGFAIVAKYALNKGTSHFTFSVYRNAIAAIIFAPFAFILERKTRPKMTLAIFLKIMLLGLLDPVIGQNLFYVGMNLTTATFTTALCNILPALTFLMAWILRVEKVNIRKGHSQAKIVGTLVTVGGAMIMSLAAGPKVGLPWTKEQIHSQPSSSNNAGHAQNPIKGALLIGAGNIGYSLFYILQSITLKSYPCGLSLTALICMMGALQGAALTFLVEKDNLAIWSIGWNAKLLGYSYGGIISSGVSYYLAGVVMKEKGPVFVTAFNPLNMVIVAVLSSFIFAEQMDVGKITGAVVIVIGLYLVIWGKSEDTCEFSEADEKSTIHQKPLAIRDSSTLKANNDVEVPKKISGNINLV